MQLRLNPQPDKPLQLVDFNSFKKKTLQKSVFFQNSKIIFYPSQQPLNIPIILAIYQLTGNNQINQEIFVGFNFDQAPKQYQAYTHEKTIKAILKIIISNTDSEHSLVSLIDQFPIIGFVLDVYARAVCMNSLKLKKDFISYRNQQQALENFAYQPRGDLLNIMTDAFGMNLTLIIGDITENYGSENNRKKLRIKFTEKEVEVELINAKKKQNGGFNIRINENSGAKNLKQLQSIQTQASESHQASSIENSSLFKESQNGKCQKCKMLANKCFCSQKGGSTYTTPKSTASNSSARSPVLGVNSSYFGILNHSKCTCNKIICICRK